VHIPRNAGSINSAAIRAVHVVGEHISDSEADRTTIVESVHQRDLSLLRVTDRWAMPIATAAIEGLALKAQSRAGMAVTDIQSTTASRPILAAES
jgi:hypothetical protein